MSSLSIIIPAYNEASRIEPTLFAIYKYLLDKNIAAEVIVVDDGSKDSTIEVVKKFPAVKLLKNEVNKGKGYSVKMGMLEAKGDLRLFLDADYSVTLENLERFVDEIENGADIVIASIELPGATISDDNYRYRRVLGHLAKQLIRSVAVPGIYDTQRGFKLFTKESTESVFSELVTNRWGFDIEILRRAQKNGIKIKELPVVWINGKANTVGLGSYFRTLFELIKIRICV